MSSYRLLGRNVGPGLLVSGLAMAAALPAWAFESGLQARPAVWDTSQPMALTLVADDGARTIYDGVFTEEQAAAGREHYMGTCATCHENTARGGPGAPGLIAYTLNNKYADMPLFSYFDYMRQNMPPGQPGWFVDEEYAEIVAFLLQMHGAPAGDTALPADEEGLSAIMIVPAP